ncbi:DUF4349 domain-containing protein [Fibrobacterota bacterium]
MIQFSLNYFTPLSASPRLCARRKKTHLSFSARKRTKSTGKPVLLILSALILTLLISGCAKSPPPPKAEGGRYEPAGSYQDDLAYGPAAVDNASMDAPASMMAEPAPMAAPARRGRAMSKMQQMESRAMPSGGSGELTAPKAQPQGAAEKRMVYYQGSITQRATDPKVIVDSAIAYVKSLEGYVESQMRNTVVLRVPVDRFQDAFDSLLQFATVLRKSISAQDITEAYQDNELRLKIARATLNRLQELLKKAEKAEDKLRLLREIKRVSENLEQLENRKTMLKTMADFSRITLTVNPHRPMARLPRQRDIAAFAWINKLDPFAEPVKYKGDYLEFAAPEGLVVLEDKKYWEAVSADGVRFRVRQLKNNPKGTTGFWFTCIRERIAERYKDHKELDAGGFKLLQSTSFSKKPYVYVVGVRETDKYLEVVEIYYPSADQEKRHSAAIVKSITAGTL